MDQRIYEEEQAHLSEVYGQLLQMNGELEQQIGNLNATAAEEKKDIMTNLRYDEADDEVLFEAYGEIETWNRYIDTYNIRSEVLSGRLKNVKILLESPYFARVTLQYEDDEDGEPEDYYIGRGGVSDEHHEPIVLDWRSPIAETYYNQENGATSYEVDGRRIPVSLLLRRQFDVNKSHLNAYFDTSLAIEDPLLVQALSRRHSDRLQDITTTIQKEQNAIIRHRDVPVMLVNGIAGSGKTSVLLQRIAWLFYQKRKTLRPEQVYLMTLNPVFRQYIDDVLPDLGERNPNTITWMEFLRMVHCPMEDPGLSTAEESLRRIDEELPKLKLEAEDLRPVRAKQGRKKKTVLGRERVLEIVRRFDGRFPLGVRLIQVTASELEEEARAELRRKKWRKKDVNEWDGLPEDPYGDGEEDEASRDGGDQLTKVHARNMELEASDVLSIAARTGGRYAGGSDAQDEEGARSSGRLENNGRAGDELTRGEENELQTRFSGTFQMIRSCEWLDIDHIGRRLLGKDKLTSIEWFYLKMALTGECDRNAQYVCIDEIQDYTLPQIMTLARYFVNARFLLLGDEYQAIRDDTVRFEEIHALFDGQKRRVAEFALDTSYRSTPEITALFAGLLPKERRLTAASVQREGTVPDIRVLKDEAALACALKELLTEAAQVDGLTAVVCSDKGSLKRLQKVLGSEAGASVHPAADGQAARQHSDNSLPSACGTPAGVETLKAVGGDVPLPKRGAFLITLANAKGLEFDHVILPDADARTYPDTELSRHRLYTAISRATQRITILAKGELTPLLRG